MGTWPPPSAPSYIPDPGVWYECAGGNPKLRVHFSSEVITELQRESVAGLRSVPDTGREIGGILLGTVETAAEGTVLRVESAVTIPCAHRQGPGYVLTAEECAGFEAAVRARHSASHAAIGYFRSQTRPDLELYDEDLALLDTCFVEPAQIVLLLKPLESGLCTAGLFLRREDGLRPDFCDLEVPFFDPNAAGVVLRRTPQPQARASEPATSRPSPMPVTAAKSPWIRRIVMSAVLTVVAVMSVFLVVFWTPYVLQRWRLWAGGISATAAPALPQQRLDLQVSSQADRLLVTWNREASVLRTARRGVLEIQDGSERKSIALEAGELTGGSLVYLPATGDLLFRLEVFLDEAHTIAESVRFLSGRTGTDSTGSILLSQTAHAVPPNAKPPVLTPERTTAPAPRRWEAPNAAVRVAQEAMPAPPSLLATANGSRAPAIPAQTLAPPPINRPTGSAAPVRPASAAAKPLRVASYEPPLVLRQFPVSVPSSVRSMLNGNASIDVRVSIDARGKVTQAEIISGASPVAHLLGLSALDAARRYQFTPARLDGNPVRSEMIVTFRFAR